MGGLVLRNAAGEQRTDFWCFARRWEDSLPGAPVSVVGSDVNEDDAYCSRGTPEREPVALGTVASVGDHRG